MWRAYLKINRCQLEPNRMLAGILTLSFRTRPSYLVHRDCVNNLWRELDNSRSRLARLTCQHADRPLTIVNRQAFHLDFGCPVSLVYAPQFSLSEEVKMNRSSKRRTAYLWPWLVCELTWPSHDEKIAYPSTSDERTTISIPMTRPRTN